MRPIETSLCRRLANDYPIIQAPIGSASGPELATAVSEAGALGMLALTWRAADEIPAIREMKARIRTPSLGRPRS